MCGTQSDVRRTTHRKDQQKAHHILWIGAALTHAPIYEPATCKQSPVQANVHNKFRTKLMDVVQTRSEHSQRATASYTFHLCTLSSQRLFFFFTQFRPLLLDDCPLIFVLFLPFFLDCFDEGGISVESKILL